MGSRQGAQLLDEEAFRDDIVVGRFDCPTCGAVAGDPCRGALRADGLRLPAVAAHTSRYTLGARAGVVPALPGGAR